MDIRPHKLCPTLRSPPDVVMRCSSIHLLPQMALPHHTPAPRPTPSLSVAAAAATQTLYHQKLSDLHFPPHHCKVWQLQQHAVLVPHQKSVRPLSRHIPSPPTLRPRPHTLVKCGSCSSMLSLSNITRGPFVCTL